MNHIAYIFINDYRSLHQVELSFDARYCIKYDIANRVLKIGHSDKLPDYFWGRSIYSLSSIVGNNGAGKSSTLCFLMDALVDGANKSSMDGIIVYENERTLYVYLPDSLHDIRIESGIIPVETTSRLTKIGTFYYSAHFLPYSNIEELRSTELSGLYNATDMNRIVKDLQNYTNIDTMHLGNGLYYHLEAYTAQNNYRICKLLSDKYFRDNFISFDLPKYLVVGVNQGGALAWSYTVSTKQRKQLPSRHITFQSSRENLIFQFCYYNIVNVMSDTDYLGDDNSILEQWLDYVDGSKDVLNQLVSFAKSKTGKARSSLESIYGVVKLISETSRYNNQRNFFYFDIVKDTSKIEELSKQSNTGLFLTSRYCNYYYCKDLKSVSETVLSSGEQELLDLFSRIYDAAILQQSNIGIKKFPNLLLLDEAEMGYHPEWQRRYIKTLVDFISAIPVKSGFDFQIIISSHSPILLSDLPKTCCNYLLKEGGQVKNVREEQHESLASNIFDLYRDSFFLKEGLIGEYAMSKLLYVKENITDIENKEVDKIISIIGDERIKRYFLKQREDAMNGNHEELIQYYSQRLAELTNS